MNRLVQVCAALSLAVMSMPTSSFAQFIADDKPAQHLQLSMSGDLRYDLFEGMKIGVPKDSLTRAEAIKEAEKSPLRAAVFSAVVPGTGQLYSESYWSGVGFLAAEIALWVVYASYDAKGDDQTAAFEKYADEHWSVVKYANWMEQYAVLLNPSATGCSGIVTNPDSSLPPWDRVDWDHLNRCEESIGTLPSTGFSHRLPRRPDQQYYELIGKYEQYSSGWDDANVTNIDYLYNISDRFKNYRDMRTQANDYYSVARTSAYLILANHVFSALHAAWRAASFNRELRLEAHLVPVPRSEWYVEFMPVATLKLEL